MEHGYVILPSRSVGAVLGDLDVSTDAAWSTGHSAIHSLVTWSEESAILAERRSQQKRSNQNLLVSNMASYSSRSVVQARQSPLRIGP